jgi:hypothetical protein
VKDVYIKTFYTLIRERCEETGFAMPATVENYCVLLLAERVEKINIIPDPSFAERYMIMYQVYYPNTDNVGDLTNDTFVT